MSKNKTGFAGLSRRQILAGGAVAATGAVAGAALIARPGDESGPRQPYFLALQDALRRAAIVTPTLIVDRDRLDRNVDTLTGHLPAGMAYRIVAKSLPSPELIAHIRARAGTDRLMTFNLPMLQSLSERMPDAGQLLGKPLPVEAARAYFASLPRGLADTADRIQWLIDTPQRLAQYEALAASVGRPLRVNLEIDVGLHRGGFEPGDALASVLDATQRSPHLELAGFMGYEPHLPKLPTLFGWRDRALQSAWQTYQAAQDQARTRFGDSAVAAMTRNAAGSPTYRFYRDTHLASEISAGSCLVKPTDFDTPLLEPHEAASFIATPVIKSLDRTRLPGLEFMTGFNRLTNPNLDKTVFIYGGHWLADPVDPPGLQYNEIFGRSSNQEMLNGGPGVDIEVDDYVFFRPHQSEAVFLQFGDIAVYSDGEIVDRWPVFPVSA